MRSDEITFATLGGKSAGDVLELDDGVFRIVGTSDAGPVTLEPYDADAEAAAAFAARFGRGLQALTTATMLAALDARLRALEARETPEPSRAAPEPDLPSPAVTGEAEASSPVVPALTCAGDDANPSEPAPPRSGFVLQTRVAELSILVDQVAQDKIAERYPPGRIAEIDAIMLDVGRKTADGEMLTEAELAAERDWNAYGALREAVMDHAQGLKSALMVSTSDQLEDIAAGLQEGWPDGSAD